MNKSQFRNIRLLKSLGRMFSSFSANTANVNVNVNVNHALLSPLKSEAKFLTINRGLNVSRVQLQKPLSQKIVVDDLNLHYVITGTGNKTLVCIPGTLGFVKGDYTFQLKGLNKEKLTVVAWDPPGYGSSRPPDRDYSGNYFKRDARLLAKLLNKLGHEKYSVLGWSQGGVTAVHLAIDFPDKVENLITLGTFARVDTKILNNKRLEFVDNWSEEMKAPFIKMYGEEYTKSSWEGWKQSLQRFLLEQDGDMGHTSILNKVQCPTLVIQGDKDPICPVEHAEYLHKNIPNSKLHLWPDGKHNLQLRYPEEFNRLIENFLLSSSG